jgi:hypothetical protein
MIVVLGKVLHRDLGFLGTCPAYRRQALPEGRQGCHRLSQKIQCGDWVGRYKGNYTVPIALRIHRG